MLSRYLACVIWCSMVTIVVQENVEDEPMGNHELVPITDSDHLPDKWVHTVVFEPVKSIQLTRSSFRVTSFFSFDSVLISLDAAGRYLNDMLRDLERPRHFDEMIRYSAEARSLKYQLASGSAHPIDHSFPRLGDAYKIHSLGKSSTIKRPKNSRFQPDVSLDCHGDPYQCIIPLKFRQYHGEVTELLKLYNYQRLRFLSGIDHMEKHHSVHHRDTRAAQLHETGTYLPGLRDPQVTPEELQVIELVAGEVQKINAELAGQIIRHKRNFFTFLGSLFGIGMSLSNSAQINRIKENIQIIHKNVQGNRKLINTLAIHLNNTMSLVTRHELMLYEVQLKTLMLNHTLVRIMNHMSYMRFELGTYLTISSSIQRAHAMLMSLGIDIDRVFDQLSVLSSHKISPQTVAPVRLREMLTLVEQGLESHPRLKLAHDPDRDIWSYYEVIRATPIIMDDSLLVILTVPLVDTTLEMDVYRVHNLPMLHPQTQLQVRYQVEGEYFAVANNGTYATLPDTYDVQLCLHTGGHLCPLKRALFPTKGLGWCVYALYLKNLTQINQMCRFQASAVTTTFAVDLGSGVWALSVLQPLTLHIRCIEGHKLLQVDGPLYFLHLSPGCEAYSEVIFIPANNEGVDAVGVSSRADFFLGLNLEYVSGSDLMVYQQLNFSDVPEDEREKLAAEIQHLPPMKLEQFNQELLRLRQYPWDFTGTVRKMLTRALPAVLLAIVVILIVLVVVGVIYYCRNKKHMGRVNNILHKIAPFVGENFTQRQDEVPVRGRKNTTSRGAEVPTPTGSGSVGASTAAVHAVANQLPATEVARPDADGKCEAAPPPGDVSSPPILPRPVDLRHIATALQEIDRENPRLLQKYARKKRGPTPPPKPLRADPACVTFRSQGGPSSILN